MEKKRKQEEKRSRRNERKLAAATSPDATDSVSDVDGLGSQSTDESDDD